MDRLNVKGYQPATSTKTKGATRDLMNAFMEAKK